MRKKVLLISAVLSALAAAVCAVLFISGTPEKQYDVLLMMVGSDLESENGSATDDLYEIIRATEKYPEKSCAVFLCGSEKWWFPELEAGNSYIMEISGGSCKILKNRKKCAGTTAEDLASFLKYGKDNCDLIFWGHGGAGMTGVGVNYLFEEDTLTLPELQTALKDSGKSFRLIGFDACSMASLPAAWTVSPYCSLFCASLLDEELSGWHYLAVMPVLLGQDTLTPERLRDAFREDGITILDTAALRGTETSLCRVMDASGTGNGALLSELLDACSDQSAASELRSALNGEDLLLTHWPDGELPSEELLPGIGSTYRAFLGRS